MKRVVVTGLGAVSPIGCGVAKFWAALRNGQCGLAPITRFDASPFRNNLAGEVKDFGDCPHAPAEKGLSLTESYALAACREALCNSGFDGSFDNSSRVGLVLGTNFGSLDCLGQYFSGEKNQLAKYNFQSLLNVVAGGIGVGGPSVVLSLSCASGVAAIGKAMDFICSGHADVMIACGCDELSHFALTGLNALRTITPDTVRPFDKNRKGTLFAEGAGALVVESEKHAKARSADCIVSVLGCAMNNDAFHMTAPDKSARGIISVMQMALSNAGVSPDDIDHVNAHGTGTPYNDKGETLAIKTVFGKRAKQIPVVSLKGTMGHTMGAAGALETIGTIMTVSNSVIPPTVGLETADPECDLDYVPSEARKMVIQTALSNSYGIGGTNAAVVVSAVN